MNHGSPAAFRELAEDQRVEAAELLAVLHREFPSSSDERGRSIQRFDLDFAERECPHLLAFALVSGAVAVAHRFPADVLAASRLKDELGGLPVSLAEGVEVALIPIGDLRVEQLLDRCGRCGVGVVSVCPQEKSRDQNGKCEGHGVGSNFGPE